MHRQAARRRRVDVLEQPQYVGTGMPFTQGGEHLPSPQIHRREQTDGAVSPMHSARREPEVTGVLTVSLLFRWAVPLPERNLAQRMQLVIGLSVRVLLGDVGAEFDM